MTHVMCLNFTLNHQASKLDFSLLKEARWGFGM